ncbi:MAG: nucleotide exchange factor GrpE [Alphaproteobacteria bacterium]|jgi:molecular chaperone GrpE|nr:nucleotide exchange factor GrpE [Alphaproteobacteria bacterium]
MSDESTRLEETEEAGQDRADGGEAGATDAPADPPEAGEAEAPESVEPPVEPTAEDRIAALEAETAELKDKLLRSLAEVDNVRKRATRETADARAYAIEKFAGDLLSVSDNLSRALDALPDNERHELSEAGRGLLGGIEMTQKELHSVMARHGVTAIDAGPGAAFDPNMHQAVSQVPSDQPSGTIAETYQTGWKIGERVLRAAMVAVSTGPAH